jgi:uncharacterized protein YjbJ (UPF0337 family)
MTMKELVNENILEGKWNQIKGKIKQQWGELTDDDIDRIRGNRTEMIGVLQEKYDISQDEAERELDEFLAALDDVQS